MKVTARVQLTVDLFVNGNWSPNWSTSQIHDDAVISAKKRLEELCRNYVTLVGQPKVIVIMAEDSK